MRTPDEITVEIAHLETRLQACRREFKTAMKNVRRRPIKERNIAIVNDIVAGLAAVEIMVKHGVGYSVLANVMFQHRQAQRAAVVRAQAAVHEAAQ